MKLISCEELKKKIDDKEDFKLVMTLGEFAFEAKHIPGSFQLDKEEKIKDLLSPDDEIVIYCANPSCVASIKAYRILTHLGFENVRRFAGGIDEWEEAGYPLEGDSVKSSE
jgi:rhodanese-related sulfurtransferase